MTAYQSSCWWLWLKRYKRNGKKKLQKGKKKRSQFPVAVRQLKNVCAYFPYSRIVYVEP